jgi:predicted transcriptional regulator
MRKKATSTVDPANDQRDADLQQDARNAAAKEGIRAAKDGLAVDHDDAVEWLRKSVKRGNPLSPPWS